VRKHLPHTSDTSELQLKSAINPVETAEETDARENVYRAIHDSMMHSFREKDHRASDRLVQQLLMHADLPKLIRARC
jgi:hypothetical protein